MREKVLYSLRDYETFGSKRKYQKAAEHCVMRLKIWMQMGLYHYMGPEELECEGVYKLRLVGNTNLTNMTTRNLFHNRILIQNGSRSDGFTVKN
jgi:hypothetical protein